MLHEINKNKVKLNKKNKTDPQLNKDNLETGETF